MSDYENCKKISSLDTFQMIGQFVQFSTVILLILCVHISASTVADNNIFICKAIGDLNNDDIPDSAVVVQDTIALTAPFTLRVFFSSKNGSYKQIVSTDSAIAPKYPDGIREYQGEIEFDKIEILKGTLIISNYEIRGGFEHTFRYQNGNFELISFNSAHYSCGGETFFVDFNLSTNVYISSQGKVDDDGVKKQNKTILEIRPLPILQAFEPSTNSYY